LYAVISFKAGIKKQVYIASNIKCIFFVVVLVSREKFNPENEELTEEWEQFAEHIIFEKKEVKDKTTFIDVFTRK
jgi:chloramphenicol O-acetyltransferase